MTQRSINAFPNPSFEAPAGPITQRTNLCTNPYLALDLTNWYTWGGPAGSASLARQTSGGIDGVPFAQATWSASTTSVGGGIYWRFSSVTPGTSYAASLAAYVTSSSQLLAASLEFYDSTATRISTITGTAASLAPSTWGRYSVVGVAPAGAMTMYLTIYSQAGTGSRNWAVGDILDATEVIIEKSSTADSYFTGNTPAANGFSYAWTGAQGTSTSIQTTPGATILRTNVVPNPSFETTNGLQTLRQNLLTNPSFETASGTATLATNLAANPSLEVDSSGWQAYQAGGTLTASRKTDGGYKGSGYYTITWTAAATSGGPYYTPTTATAGSTYSASIRVRTSKALNMALNMEWYDSTGAQISRTSGTQITTTAGRWVEMDNIAAVAPTGAVRLQFTAYPTGGSSWVSGDVIDVDALMVVSGSTLPTYFDGSTPSTTTRTNRVISPEVTQFVNYSTAVGVNSSRWTGDETYSLLTGLVGAPQGITTAGRITWTTTAASGRGFSIVGNTDGSAGSAQSKLFPVIPGDQMTLLASVRPSTGTMPLHLRYRYQDPNGNFLDGNVYGTAVTPAAGAWTNLSETFTVPAGVGYVSVIVALEVSATVAIGDTLDITAVYIGESGGYVAGDLPATRLCTYAWTGTANSSTSVETTSTDFSYGWSGTAGASTSAKTAPGVATVTGSSPTTYQSSVWSAVGSKSVALAPTGAASDYMMIQVSVSPSTTYTLQATAYSPTQVTLGSALQARDNASASTLYGVAAAAGTSVGPGSSTFSATFTTDSAAAVMRIMIPRSSTATTLYWDSFVLVPGTYTGGYFDGSTSSTSVRTNYATNPRGLGPDVSPSIELTPRWYGGGDNRGNLTTVSPTPDGPVPYLDSYLRKTWTVAVGGPNDVAYSLVNHNVPVSPGEVWTFSYWWRISYNSAPTQNYVSVNFQSASTGQDISADQIKTANFPDPGSNTWQRVSITFTVPVGVGSVNVEHIFYPGTPMPVGTTLDGTGLLAEKSGSVGSYFDGSFPQSGHNSYAWSGAADNSTSTDTVTSDYTYAWSGTPNASTSLQQAQKLAGVVSGSGVIAIQSGDWASSRGDSFRIIPNSSSGDASCADIPLNLTAGTTYTVLATARLTQALTGTLSGNALKILVVGSTGPTLTYSKTATNAAGVYEVRATFTALSGNNGIRLYNGAPQGGGDVWWDDVLVVSSTYTGPYFDGDSAASGDIFYDWQGVPGNSLSYQRGQGLYQVTGGIQSLDWAGSGVYSLRIIPTGSSTDTFASPGFDTGALRLGMVPGNTYTVLATFRQSAPQTGTLYPNRARGIVPFYRPSGASSYSTGTIAQADNVAGVQRLRTTFTIPAGSTEAFIRLYNGASQYNGDVYWDDFLLVEGNYTGDYFDGNTPAYDGLVYAWSGMVNSSTSYATEIDGTVGVELMVYSGQSPTTAWNPLPRRSGVSSMSEISGGNGANAFSILESDQALTDIPTLLDYRNVVKLSCNGIVTDAYLVQNKKMTMISGSDGTQYQMDVTGEGLRTWFNDAVIYPEVGLQTSSYGTRFFNFGSAAGTWFHASDWTSPIVNGDYDPTLPLSFAKPWRGAPSNWPPAAASAKWIWGTGYSRTTPVGDNYFRKSFSTSTKGDYSLYITADDYFEAYIDSQLVVSSTKVPDNWQNTFSTTVTLPPGPHMLAIKGTNTGGPASIIAALFVASDASSNTFGQRILETGDPGWDVSVYPAIVPGWTPGDLLLQLLTEAKNRGVLFPTFLNPTFTSALDSYGKAWGSTFTWNFAVGTSYSNVIQAIEQMGFEIWIDPDSLNLNVVPFRGTDRSVPIGNTDAVILANGLNLLQADGSAQAAIINSMVMQTNDGFAETHDSTSIEKYGQLEGSSSITGTGTQGVYFAQHTISLQANPDNGSTYSLVPTSGCIPNQDFFVGDYVQAPDSTGVLCKRRVVSITTSEDVAGNPVYVVEFDTIFQALETRLTDWVNQAANGTVTTAAMSIGSAAPSPVSSTVAAPLMTYGATKWVPTIPSGLSSQLTLDWDATGNALTTVYLSWSAVTQNLDGSSAQVLDYEIWGKNNSVTTSDYHTLVQTPGTAVSIPGLSWGTNWSFKLRALVANGASSDFSSELTIDLNPPVPALDAPTDPTVTCGLAAVTVVWDGMLNQSTPASPPPRFDHVSVLMATSQTGTYSDVGQSLTGPGSAIMTGLIIGSTYWFQLVAVDKLGVVSASSTQVSVVVVGVSMPDVDHTISDAINNAQNSADAAQTSANTAQTTADGKNTIYYQATAPTGTLTTGDTWFDTANGNRPNTWNGSAWVSAQDSSIATAQTSANNAQTTADGKNTVYYQTSAPSGGTYKVNDVWFDTSHGNKPNTWNGSAWVSAQDASIATAQTSANTAKTSAIDAQFGAFSTPVDSSRINNWLFTQVNVSTPSGTVPTFDLMIGHPYTSKMVADSAGPEVNIGDNYLSNLRALINVTTAGNITFTATHDDGGVILLDGAVVYSSGVYTQNVSISFAVSVGWHVLDLLIAEHTGGDGWSAITPTIGSQVATLAAPYSLSATSSTASSAQTAANNAQTSANGKNAITYSANAASGSGTTAGDIWYQTSSGVVTGQWLWNGTAWISQALANSVISSLDAGKITSGFIASARIQANTITAAQMVTGTITAASGIIANAAIGTAQIAAASITNALIADATIQSAKIAALDAGKISTGYLDSARIAAGTVSAAQMVTGTITASSGVIASLDAGKISTGYLDSARIAANTITSSQILIGDFTNLAVGSNFESAAANPWTLGAAWAIDTAQHYAGTSSLHCTGTLTGTSTLGPKISAHSGDQWYFELWAYRDATWNGSTGSVLRFTDQANTIVASVAYSAAQLPATTWTRLSGSFTVASASTSITATLNTDATAGNLWVDEISLRRKNEGSLIVSGSITTDLLAANAIDGFTITGAVLQTTTATASGLKLNSAGLTAYDTGGNATVTIDAATGKFTATSGSFTGTVNATGGTFSGNITISGGTMASAATGTRVELSGSSMNFYSDQNTVASVSALNVPYNGASHATLKFITDFGNVFIGPTGLVNPDYVAIRADSGTLSTFYSNSILNSSGQLSAPNAIQGGMATFSQITLPAGSGTNLTVTLATNRFDYAPIVTANADSSRLTVSISAITTTGFNIRIDNWSSGTLPVGDYHVNWMAVQMLSSATAG